MNRVKEVVRGLVMRSDGLVLVLQRGGQTRNYPGGWELPGGKKEDGESNELALNRELFEEAGIEAVVDSKSWFSFDEVSKGEVLWKQHVARAVVSDIESRRTRVSDEHQDYCWVTLPQLRQIELTPESAFALGLYGLI